jgi:hypothetical protein
VSDYDRVKADELMSRALGSGEPTPARIKTIHEMFGFLLLELVDGVRKIGERLDEAEQSLLRLEEHPPFEYRGVYEPGKTYPKGSFVTQGGIWYATEETKQPPGHGIGWKLAVRAGRDGRDGKDAT